MPQEVTGAEPSRRSERARRDHRRRRQRHHDRPPGQRGTAQQHRRRDRVPTREVAHDPPEIGRHDDGGHRAPAKARDIGTMHQDESREGDDCRRH